MGITPAYAGKRQLSILYSRGSGDHPRLCGEKFVQNVGCTGGQGSPPPMRGKAKWAAVKTRVYRITPAYAGKSLTFLYRSDQAQDHPRLCGEK